MVDDQRDLGPAKFALGRALKDAFADASTWEDFAEQAAVILAPAQIYRRAKADGLRAALVLVEGEATERDTKGMGSPGRRLIRLIGDRLRGAVEVMEREDDDDTLAPRTALAAEGGAGDGFQARNAAWMAEVMRDDPTDLAERLNRFGEEALELGQSLGQTAAEAHALVDYVHGRPKGEPAQEVGGTMTTLALLCSVADIDMAAAGEAELARCATPEIRAKIREKRSKRHGRGPLPGTWAPDFKPAPRTGREA